MTRYPIPPEAALTIPRSVERVLVVALLLLALALRVWDIHGLPPGFSDAEMQNAVITEDVRDGLVRVFYETENGGQESLYPLLNAVFVRLMGDGLLSYRLLGLWANLLALAFIYRAARQLFGAGVALLALAIMTTNIGAILLARNAVHTTLMPFFAACTLVAMIQTYRLYRPVEPFIPQTISHALLGFLAGIAIYAHFTGFLLSLMLLLFVLYLWRTHQPVSRFTWSSSLFTLILISVVTLPYLISLFRSPDSSGLYLLWRERPRTLLDLGESFIGTVGALFWYGDTNPTRNVPGLPLLWPMWALLSAFGLAVAVRRWREPVYALLLITLFVGLLPDIWLRGGANFSALVLTRPVLAILAGIGAFSAAGLASEQRLAGGWRFVAALVGLGLLWSGWQSYQRLIQEWPERSDVRLAYHADVGALAVYLETSADATPMLVCSDNLRRTLTDNGYVRWSDPERLMAMLRRDDIRLRFADCRSAFVLINGGQTMRIALLQPSNLVEASPAIQMWFREAETLNTPDLPDNVLWRLNAVNRLAQLGGQLAQTTNLDYPRMDRPPEQVQRPTRFGRNITLLGAETPPPGIYQPGDVLTVTTYWRVDGLPPSRLGIFTRLHDTPQSSPYTETNALDVLVPQLETRDVIIQVNYMTVPDLLPGEYLITLGAYDNNTLNQITVFNEPPGETTLQPRGDYLIVQPSLQIEIDDDSN